MGSFTVPLHAAALCAPQGKLRIIKKKIGLQDESQVTNSRKTAGGTIIFGAVSGSRRDGRGTVPTGSLDQPHFAPLVWKTDRELPPQAFYSCGYHLNTRAKRRLGQHKSDQISIKKEPQLNDHGPSCHTPRPPCSQCGGRATGGLRVYSNQSKS